MSMNPVDPAAEGNASQGVRCECLLLCDAAEAVNGKLYIVGGGWNQLQVPSIPTVHPALAFAIRLSIPWHDANDDIPFALRMLNADGKPVAADPLAEGTLNVGRPPGTTPGSELPAVMAMTLHNFEIKRFGAHVVTFEIRGAVAMRTTFTVIGARPR